MRPSRAFVLALPAMLLTALALLPGTALAAEFAKDDRPELLVVPTDYPETPDAFDTSAEQAVDIANQTPEVNEQRNSRGKLRVDVADVNAAWEVSYYDDDLAGKPKVALVLVNGVGGSLREAWTGHQVAWPMARGSESQFGHILNAPYVWLPLSLLFLLGLANWRRPLRIAHLDLLVLLGFGVSHIFFNNGEIGLSAPLAYPPLVYLLGRMLWIGYGKRSRPLQPSASTLLLALVTVALIAVRITFNIADSGVIDVGYAGVIGADRIERGEDVWGPDAFPENNPTGDTYGPANYLSYVPFHQVLGWSGEWDELPAARAAAIAFDLLAIAGLFFLGQVLGGAAASGRRWLERNRLGIILAFGWTAFPYTDYALQSSSNDSLLAAGVIWALVLFARPAARGAVLAYTAMTKFAPLILAPLFVAGRNGLDPRRLREPLLAGLAFAIVALALLAWPLISPGLDVFYERTISSQANRESPFSIWGQADLGPLQQIVWVATALFALSLAFLPRTRTLPQICALAAATILAIQLTIDHWFYLYIPWFFGPLLAALVASRSSDDPDDAVTDGQVVHRASARDGA